MSGFEAMLERSKALLQSGNYGTKAVKKSAPKKPLLEKLDKAIGVKEIHDAFAKGWRQRTRNYAPVHIPSMSYSSISSFYKGLRKFHPTPYQVLEYWVNEWTAFNDKDFFVLGKALESIVCGGMKTFNAQFKLYKGKKTPAIKQAAEAEGKIAIRQTLLDKALVMAKELEYYEPFSKIMANDSLVMQGDKFFKYGLLEFRSIPDFLFIEDGQRIGADLKTSQNVSDFAEAIFKEFNYWIQAVVSCLAFDLTEFRFIAVQSTKPFLTHTIVINGSQLDELKVAFHNKVVYPFIECLEHGFYESYKTVKTPKYY